MSVFSSEFWRSLYFRAIGGQASEAAGPTGEMAAVITASSSLVATISFTQRTVTETGADTHDGISRTEQAMAEVLRTMARAQDNREKIRRADTNRLQDIIRRALGEKDPPKPKPTAPAPVEVVADRTAEIEAARLEAERLEQQKAEDDALIILLLAA
jgi:hypothetical protein